jgi:putative transposase
MSRGNRGDAIFSADSDRILFLEILRQVIARRAWQVFAYCLMDNHYHLVVQTPDPDLPAGMRSLNGDYAQWFNKLYGLVGHVFQARYHAVAVESDWHLLQLTRYLALNPVRAGLCESPADWLWGSYGSILSGKSSALISGNRTLRHFGGDSRNARAAFLDFVEGGSPRVDKPIRATAGPGPAVSRLAMA